MRKFARGGAFAELLAAITFVVAIGLIIMACATGAKTTGPQVIDVSRPEVTLQGPEGPTPARFEITSAGTFRAGYGSHEREILYIKDRETGKVYIGITGVGITELWTETRGKHTETVEE